MGNTAWEKYDDAQLGMVEIAARHYKEFLDAGKTERECVREAIRMAELADYVNLQDVLDGKYLDVVADNKRYKKKFTRGNE